MTYLPVSSWGRTNGNVRGRSPCATVLRFISTDMLYLRETAENTLQKIPIIALQRIHYATRE